MKTLRWKIAPLLNRLPGTCWANLVTWAEGWDRGGEPVRQYVRQRWSCEPSSCGSCYCGKRR